MIRVFLLGFMGSGKSTLGKQLAARLDITFVDLDRYIENKTGRTISNIISSEGEDTFRKSEYSCLRESLQEDAGMVMATGGGTPIAEENLAFMKANGLTIYLKQNVDLIYSRLQHNIEQRPLIANYSGQVLKDRINELLDKRQRSYCKAHYTVEGLGRNRKDVESLLKIVRDYYSR